MLQILIARELLGKKVTDRITDVKGTAVGVSEYLNGCIQVCIEAKADKEGKVLTTWTDLQRVIVIPKLKKGGPSSQHYKN